MAEFKLKDVHSDPELVFEGDIPRGLQGYDGCRFTVSLIGTPLSATVLVYDIQPQRWGDFFADLAMSWPGWDNKKECQSLEEHLRVAATHDRLGHIRLRVYLRDVNVGSDWSAETSIWLEAGQLEDVAKRARQYFG